LLGVAALPQGVAAYTTPSAAGQVASVATCNNAVVTTPAVSGSPSTVQVAPDAQRIIAVGSAWNDLSYTVNTSNETCPPGLTDSLLNTAAYPGITPHQLVITGDSHYAFVTGYNLPTGQTATQPNLYYYDLTAKAAGAAPIAAGGGQLTSGGVTLDSKQLYVGVKAVTATGETNAVHRFDLTGATPTDAQQISTTFAPEFVAVRQK
jgi:hypothetical protein